MTTPRIRIFVYGTLRRLCGNFAHYLKEATFVGSERTMERFTMYDLDGCPTVVPGGDIGVAGEVYDVTAAEFASIDSLEGYPSFYDRKRTKLADGTHAWIYFMSEAPDVFRGALIPTGNWLHHIRRERRIESARTVSSLVDRDSAL